MQCREIITSKSSIWLNLIYYYTVRKLCVASEFIIYYLFDGCFSTMNDYHFWCLCFMDLANINNGYQG